MSAGPNDLATLPEVTAQRHDDFFQPAARQEPPNSSPPTAQEVRDDRSEFDDAMGDEEHITTAEAEGVAQRARQHKESMSRGVFPYPFGAIPGGPHQQKRWNKVTNRTTACIPREAMFHAHHLRQSGLM